MQLARCRPRPCGSIAAGSIRWPGSGTKRASPAATAGCCATWYGRRLPAVGATRPCWPWARWPWSRATSRPPAGTGSGSCQWPGARGEWRVASKDTGTAETRGRGDAGTRGHGDKETGGQRDKENVGAPPLALATQSQVPNPNLSPKSKSPNPKSPTCAWPGYPDTHLDPAAVRRGWCWFRSWRAARLGQAKNWPSSGPARRGPGPAGRPRSRLRGRRWASCWPRAGCGRSQSPSPDWPTLAGCPARTRSPRRRSTWRAWPGGCRCRELRPAAAASGPPRRPTTPRPLSYHPVVVGDRVFVNDQREIVAVRLADGQAGLGRRTARPFIARRGRAAAAALANPADTLGAARFTMTVCDGRLYARMGSAVTSQPQQAGRRPAVPGSLVCLDLEAEGKLLWKVAPEEGWAFEGRRWSQGPASWRPCAAATSGRRPTSPVSTPRPAGSAGGGSSAAAETPARGMLPQSTHNLLTLAGDTLYYNTNLGAVAALSADDGRVLWVSLYPRAPPRRPAAPGAPLAARSEPLPGRPRHAAGGPGRQPANLRPGRRHRPDPLAERHRTWTTPSTCWAWPAIS